MDGHNKSIFVLIDFFKCYKDLVGFYGVLNEKRI
jgi:hypothetical protein